MRAALNCASSVTVIVISMKLAPDTLLLMRGGENPLIVKKLRHCTDKEFAGLFDPA